MRLQVTNSVRYDPSTSIRGSESLIGEHNFLLWLEDLDPSHVEVSLALQGFRIARICRLAQEALSSCKDSESLSDRVVSTIAELEAAYVDLEASWSATLPGRWMPRPGLVCETIWVANTWNQYRSLLLWVAESLLACYDALPIGDSASAERRAEVWHMGETTVGAVLASIPYLTAQPTPSNDIGVNHLTRQEIGLYYANGAADLVSHCLFANEAQRQHAKHSARRLHALLRHRSA